MAKHVSVRQIAGRWAVLDKRGRVIQTHDTEREAIRAHLPAAELTPEEQARRFGDPDHAARKAGAREAELIARLDAGLPLGKLDAREARRLKRERSA